MPPAGKLFVLGFAIKSLKIYGIMKDGTVAGTDPEVTLFVTFDIFCQFGAFKKLARKKVAEDTS
jgi:hypothetical protein